MSTRLRPARTILAIAVMVAFPSISHAQVKVLISGGFSAAYRELLPEFEKASGIAVTTASGGSVGNGPNTIGGQIRRGVPTDVIILAREGLKDLISEGRVAPGTDVDLARSVIGMVVHAGAPKPDISTVEAFKRAMLEARSVAVSTSTSGVYLTTTLFPQLGIGDQMAKKTTMNGAAAVGRGEAEVGLQQVSEVLPIPNTLFVGQIPDQIQYVTTYAAAVVAGAQQPEAAKRLVAFLSSEAAMAAIKRSGMEPSRRR